MPELQKPAGEWTLGDHAEGSKFLRHCNGKPAWSCTDHVRDVSTSVFVSSKGRSSCETCGCVRSVCRSLMEMTKWEVYPGSAVEAHLTNIGSATSGWTLKGPWTEHRHQEEDFPELSASLAFLFAAPDPSEINSGVYLRGIHPWQADIWEHKWGSGLWGVRTSVGQDGEGRRQTVLH